MGNLVKLISYKVKLHISELLTWETMYSVFLIQKLLCTVYTQHNWINSLP